MNNKTSKASISTPQTVKLYGCVFKLCTWHFVSFAVSWLNFCIGLTNIQVTTSTGKNFLYENSSTEGIVVPARSRLQTWLGAGYWRLSNKWATAWQNQQNDLCTQSRNGSTWASSQSDQSLLCALRVAKDPNLVQMDSEDSDQTGRMPRLILVLAAVQVILLVLSDSGSKMNTTGLTICGQSTWFLLGKMLTDT